jgi:hypothetical protein
MSHEGAATAESTAIRAVDESPNTSSARLATSAGSTCTESTAGRCWLCWGDADGHRDLLHDWCFRRAPSGAPEPGLEY